MRLRKAFVKHSSANIKLLKTQLHKMEQSGGFLGRLLRPLLKTELPLMKNDIIKITKYLQESGLLVKDVRKTIKNEAKE